MWEAAFGFSDFLLKALSRSLPVSWWVIFFFEQKTAWPQCPTLPIYQLSPWVTFFVFLDEKSPQRETFCRCGIGDTKNGRSTKKHQNRWVQKLFWAMEKSLGGCIASNGEYFEGDWSLNMLEYIQFFISKFHILGSSLIYRTSTSPVKMLFTFLAIYFSLIFII